MSGCFVPAEYGSFRYVLPSARLSLAHLNTRRVHDALLTRLSNDDDMEKSLSTFANEMASSAMILGASSIEFLCESYVLWCRTGDSGLVGSDRRARTRDVTEGGCRDLPCHCRASHQTEGKLYEYLPSDNVLIECQSYVFFATYILERHINQSLELTGYGVGTSMSS